MSTSDENERSIVEQINGGAVKFRYFIMGADLVFWVIL